MQKIFENYIQSISTKFTHEETSEMGYRSDFENLIGKIFESIKIKRIDHDARARQGNKPDFVVYNHEIPILYIEAKDINTSLDKIEKSKQMARYYGYVNLVLTNYIEFRFYRNGLRYEEPIKIADYDIKSRTITPIPDNYQHVAKTLIDFTQSHKEPIRSGKHLSKIMGGKAQRIRDNVRQFLATESEKNAELAKVYEAIKKLLVHDLTLESFADMYAQTLVYGLFVARYHDETPQDFSRQEARDLIPKSNPLLRHFFDHIVGSNFDKRLKYIVNELCEVFSHADVQELMKEYFKNDLWGETHRGPDPVIHFYEDFLKEYDPVLRKKLGAYYTPLPVVQFIVRSVDCLLKKEFDLPAGLADTSKIDGVHKVQILDPAVGTGTFISKVIRIIYKHLLRNNQKGRWPTYVHNDLLPRLHGFELMMAPYTIAHLKLSMAFKETGFKYFNDRLGIYLTNSLEESATQESLFTTVGFAGSIAEESKEASIIKNKKPIMVVLGNPPYSISSQNKGKWILNLIEDYKKGLKEKKINIDDDYIKFIRFAEHFIEKNKTGIVAMITNNSFIDGITHRQMRKHLLETFDEIYILDLHGNSKKKEKAPDGSKDENVFNITQGVSINIFVRKSEAKSQLGNVYHAELYGLRDEKFISLNKSDIHNVKWNKLKYNEPYYFFVPKDFGVKEEYEKGFKIDDMFCIGSSGIESAKDNFIVKFSDKEAIVLKDFIEVHSDKEIADKYNLKSEKASQVKEDSLNIIGNSTELLYRPFDLRYTLYSPNSQGVWWRPKFKVMQHLLKDNLALLTCRQQTSFDFQHVFLSKNIVERCAVSLQTGEVSYVFPLYVYSDDGSKTQNLNQGIVDQIERITGKVSPEDVFDYVYAVLHSPRYREQYKEFLKIDFPRVPYPKDAKTFKKLVELGQELRQLHLLESPKVSEFITTYSVAGSDVVEKIPEYKDGKVFINNEQYFGQVPESAWNFYIGGYQPAQKWLKVRKDRTLTNSDIEHYQKIIKVLVETDRIMKEIDSIGTL